MSRDVAWQPARRPQRRRAGAACIFCRWLLLLALLAVSLSACKAPAVAAGRKAAAQTPLVLPTAARAQTPTAGGASRSSAPTSRAITATPGGVPVVVIADAIGEEEPEVLAVSPEWSLVRGGVDLGSGAPVTLSYPAALTGDELVTFSDLQVLVADEGDANYHAFVNDLSGQVFVYSDLLTGVPVLNVHVGTIRLTGRKLEAEPLRALIEGDLYEPFALEEISTNLQQLLGRTVTLTQGASQTRFFIVAAVRLSATDVAAYQTRPGELSSVLGRIAHPEKSMLMHICSGQQPGEPETPFPGRYLLLLEY